MLDDDNMAHYTKVVDITKRKENKKVMDKVKKVLDDIKLTLFGTYLCIYIHANTCPEAEVWGLACWHSSFDFYLLSISLKKIHGYLRSQLYSFALQWAGQRLT